jgi:hypothetical protein
MRFAFTSQTLSASKAVNAGRRSAHGCSQLSTVSAKLLRVLMSWKRSVSGRPESTALHPAGSSRGLAAPLRQIVPCTKPYRLFATISCNT